MFQCTRPNIGGRRDNIGVDSTDSQSCSHNTPSCVKTGSHRTQGCASELREYESEWWFTTGPLDEHGPVSRGIPCEKGRIDEPRRIASELLLNVCGRKPIGKHPESAA